MILDVNLNRIVAVLTASKRMRPDGQPCPLREEARLALRNQEFEKLFSLPGTPDDFQTAEEYFDYRVLIDLFRKCKDISTSVDLHRRAVDLFHENEVKNFHSNFGISRNEFHLFNEFADRVLSHTTRILGRIPRTIEGRFGPGATYADKGAKTTVAHKMSSLPTITKGALPLLDLFWRTAWGRALIAENRMPRVVLGNRFTSVPKDSRGNRGICIEPSLNLFFQLGIGGEIRKRLLKEGIDLNRNQDLHRQRAQLGSVTGDLATIDLSNASDLISEELVRRVIPPDWFDLLHMTRSPYTLIDGKQFRLEKFSSMGNGYTFELETLIFYCICLAVRDLFENDGEILVYGDDIIVPDHLAPSIMDALETFGLEINRQKSFLKGNFRESCGGDYFKGKDVRPYFLKEFPYGPQGWIGLSNGLRRNLNSLSSGSDLLRDYRRAWFRAIDQVPLPFRNKGPEELGDIVIHDDESEWKISVKNSIRYIRTLSVQPWKKDYYPWDGFSPGVVLACALYGVNSGGGSEKFGPLPYLGLLPRRPRVSLRVRWTAIP